jgi:hypothetical protein
MSDERSPSGRPWLTLTAVILLLSWRGSIQPLSGLWRDWIVVLALYVGAAALYSRSPSWPRVTLSVMAYLLGLYVMGQLPHTLIALGFGS